MKRENWQKVKQIFNDALEIEPLKRKAFLDKICANDNDLRHDVEILLNSFEHDFLENPAVGQVADVIVEQPFNFHKGDKIGDYEILKALGTGGQGAVYLAQDLQLNRNIAIKFLPAEASTDKSAEKRFRREAQAAAALSHPNICAIHKIEEEENRAYLVMQYIEGETLSNKLKCEKLDLKTALDIAIQIADALNEAHTHNIIHRDIKPSNIIISPNKKVTVLDFGLAKQVFETTLDTKTSLTKSGAIMGTAAYMSPEQSRGKTTDGRTDIWSLGVCLYEMLSGKNPFLHESIAETFAAILSFEPDLKGFPPPLAKIISRTLQKNVDKRYQNIKELLSDLRELRDELSFEAQLQNHDLISGKTTAFGWKQIVLAVAILFILTVGGSFYWQNHNLNWAQENVKKVVQLTKEDKTFEAYDLALQVKKYLPNDESLVKLMPLISDNLTVKTEPAGAKIYLKRFQPLADGKFPEREYIGQTPLVNLQIARGQYLLYLEKEGFAPVTRSISGRLPSYTSDLIWMPPIEVSAKLIEAEKVPDKMSFVPSGEYHLVSYSLPTEKTVQLGDFLVDRFEVSNADFKEFITAGGYHKKEFWQVPILKDGKEIPFEKAVENFKDRTGLNAPRSWMNQNFPEGKDNFPVTDITWYEASAYAKFRGKSLPTIFQWEKSARDGKFDEGYNTMPWGLSRDADSPDLLANFGSDGTTAVDNFQFGMSPYGCLNMAGNVSEWMFNTRGKNVLVGGGSWGERPYLFGYFGDFPPDFSSNKVGFRLVKNLSDKTDGSEPMLPVEIPEYKASSETDFKKWITHYVYDKIPLDAQIIETIETDSWTREKVSYIGADREKVIAYLYLPKNFPRPLQVVHWIPAADVPLGFSSLTHSVEDFLPPVIKSGRAVFAIALKGYSDRPPKRNDVKGVELRKETVKDITDWRRGIDYLETRNDIDIKSLGFIGLSWGGDKGLILTAVENRYVSAAYVGIGVRSEWAKWIAEGNIVNFAPHTKIPKLVVKGRYDEAHQLKTEAEPLFKIMSEPKRLTIVESGHVPPPEIFAPIINNWLDETLGKVKNP
ncbi:MAG: protein kinase [Pyrinomonadaceae bacterium]|nr:protein kinase [Pyrinomonadaceae bacterium]